MYCLPSTLERFHTAHNRHVIPSLTVSYDLQHTAHNKLVIPSQQFHTTCNTRHTTSSLFHRNSFIRPATHGTQQARYSIGNSFIRPATHSTQQTRYSIANSFIRPATHGTQQARYSIAKFHTVCNTQHTTNTLFHR